MSISIKRYQQKNKVRRTKFPRGGRLSSDYLEEAEKKQNRFMNMKNYEATQFHLREAQEHLEKLIRSVNEGKEDAVTFRIQMGHLYHHVNSAWNTRRVRSLDDPILHEKFLEFAEHPTDLTAWGF